jgi:hypothetical protein
MFPTTQSKGCGAHHQTGQELFRATRPVLFESTGSSARLPGNFQVDVAPVDNFGSSSTGPPVRFCSTRRCSSARLPIIFESPTGVRARLPKRLCLACWHNFLSSSTRLRAPVHDDRGVSKSILFPWITSGDLRPGRGHDFPVVSECPAGAALRFARVPQKRGQRRLAILLIGGCRKERRCQPSRH